MHLTCHYPFECPKWVMDAWLFPGGCAAWRMLCSSGRQPHFPGISAVECRRFAVSGKMPPVSARGRSVSRPFSHGRRDSGLVPAALFLYVQSRTKTGIIRAAAGSRHRSRSGTAASGYRPEFSCARSEIQIRPRRKLYNFVRFVPVPFVPAILNEVRCSF